MATIMDAITAAINVEAIKADATKTPEQKQAEVNEQLAIVAQSDVKGLADMGQEAVENRQEVNNLFEQAGIDPVQFRREQALGGTEQVINAIQQLAGGDEAPQIEG